MSRANQKERMCDTCRFWKFDGDLKYPSRASNEGICGWFLDAQRKAVPIWAQDLARATISFHGRGCGAWERRTKKTIKVLKSK